MTCPRCFALLTSGPNKCPECGLHLAHNVSGVVKTSAVMIAVAGEHGFYRSVQDVPEPLRRQLLEITASRNSGTIVIADRAGKEQISQAIVRKDAVDRRGATGTASRSKPEPRLPGRPLMIWAGVGLLLTAAGIIGAVFRIH